MTEAWGCAMLEGITATMEHELRARGVAIPPAKPDESTHARATRAGALGYVAEQAVVTSWRDGRSPRPDGSLPAILQVLSLVVATARAREAETGGFQYLPEEDAPFIDGDAVGLAVALGQAVSTFQVIHKHAILTGFETAGRMTRGGAKGGAAGASRRRAKAAVWEAQARERALEIAAEGSIKSVDWLATEIAGRWKLAGDIPSSSSLRRLATRLRDDGVISIAHEPPS